MEPIDWQELYAANQAVIAGARPGAQPREHAACGRRRPAALTLPSPGAGLPGVGAALPGVGAARTLDTGGAGSWERLEHSIDGRARPSFAYTPPGLSPGTPVGLLVLLHGCAQGAADIAAAARMHALADRHGFVVAYPEQAREDNVQGCWNWFAAAHQTREAGEPAYVAEVVRAMLAAGERWTLDPERVFVAGLSSGGAMASVVAATHPERFAGLAVHSGLPFGAARDLNGAFAAMAGRGAGDPESQGRAARLAMGHRGRAVPALVIHGTADRTVAPAAGEATVRQWLETNRLASEAGADPGFAEPAEVVSREAGDGARGSLRRRWRDRHGRVMAEHLAVEGLGHAWAGGRPGAPYADPSGPSASEAMVAFFGLAEHERRVR